MRRGAVLLLLAVGACRDHASSPAAGTATGHPIAVLRELAAAVCACRDAPCREGVRARWTAAVRERPAVKEPTQMSRQDILDEAADGAAYTEVRARYLGCLEPDHGPDRMRARLGAFADRACTCDRDAGCIATIKAEEDHYLEDAWGQQDGFTDLDRQRISDELRRFAICAAPP